MSMIKNKFFFAEPGRFLYHDVLEEIGALAGIYRLHVGDELGDFLFLPRLLEADPYGILYIGAAVRLHERLGELQKALSVAYHRGQWIGSRHGLLGKIKVVPNFVERFPYERLFVTLQPLTELGEGNPDLAPDQDHYVQERRLLTEYRQRYGELPPLNAH